MLPFAHSQGQRALKRQKSLPNGDPAIGSPTGAGAGGAAAYGGAGGEGDWVRKCWGVLNAIYADVGPKEYCYNLPAKDVFYKTVSETFPGVATQYYSIVRNPITFRDIEGRLHNNMYEGPQQFADVSASPCGKGLGGDCFSCISAAGGQLG